MTGKTLIALLLTVIVLACGGCAHVIPVPQKDVFQKEAFCTPPLAMRSTASVGDTLISKGNLLYRDSIKLKADYTTMWINNGGMRNWPFTFSAGSTLKYVGYHNGAKFYAGPVTGGLVGGAYSEKGPQSTNYGIGIDDNGNVRYVYVLELAIDETPGRQVGFTNSKLVEVSEDSFKQEFIYNGKSRDQYFFIYREFIKDIVRPAFTQEVKYSISDGDIIGFKKLKVRVFRASNFDVEYEILESF